MAVQPSLTHSGHFVHLDFLRGIAALAVVVGHVRNFLLVPYGDLVEPSVGTAILYLVGGLGHQAVMVFFVLSGFVIAGSIERRADSGTWTWDGYALDRIVRLWIVLVPALVITLAVDSLRFAFGGSPNMGPEGLLPVDHGFITFVGNLLFLQTIKVPVFGTNGPLWSLAHEFWYYAAFPLLYVGIARRNLWHLGAAVGVTLFTGKHIALYSLVWLAGAGAKLLMSRFDLSWFRRPFVVLLLAAASLGTVVWSRLGHHFLADLALGLCVAALLPALVAWSWAPRTYRWVADALAKPSYTLYAVHYPLLGLIWSVWLGGVKYEPSPGSVAQAIAVTLGLVAVSALVYSAFEKHTTQVRSWVGMVLGHQRSHPATEHKPGVGLR